MADLSRIWSQCQNCTQCGLGLMTNRRSPGAGNPQAKVLIVGDIPHFYNGDARDWAPTPLGTFLSQMLSIIDLSLDSVYFTTLVKCLPYENRNPMATELETCRAYLRQQFALMEPDLIICLGGTVAQPLISDRFQMARDHGTFVVQNGVTITAIYHPADLLRQPNLRPDTFVDLKKIQSKLAEIGQKV